MPFDFQLRGLLRLRKVHEQRERMRLILLNASRSRLRAELDEAARRRVAAFEALERKLESGMEAGELAMEEALLQGSLLRRNEIAKLIEALDLQVARQVEAYWESQKKRKVIESVREREWHEYRLIEDRREQQRVDDLFARRQDAVTAANREASSSK